MLRSLSQSILPLGKEFLIRSVSSTRKTNSFCCPRALISWPFLPQSISLSRRASVQNVNRFDAKEKSQCVIKASDPKANEGKAQPSFLSKSPKTKKNSVDANDIGSSFLSSITSKIEHYKYGVKQMEKEQQEKEMKAHVDEEVARMKKEHQRDSVDYIGNSTGTSSLNSSKSPKSKRASFSLFGLIKTYGIWLALYYWIMNELLVIFWTCMLHYNYIGGDFMVKILKAVNVEYYFGIDVDKLMSEVNLHITLPSWILPLVPESLLVSAESVVAAEEKKQQQQQSKKQPEDSAMSWRTGSLSEQNSKNKHAEIHQFQENESEKYWGQLMTKNNILEISARFIGNFTLASAFMSLWTPLQVPFCVLTLPYLVRVKDKISRNRFMTRQRNP